MPRPLWQGCSACTRRSTEPHHDGHAYRSFSALSCDPVILTAAANDESAKKRSRSATWTPAIKHAKVADVQCLTQARIDGPVQEDARHA